MRLGITTRPQAAREALEIAQAAVAQWSLPYVERGGERLETLLETWDALLVWEPPQWSLADSRGTLRYSPGLAQLRLKGLDAGANDDRFLRAAQLWPGDEVLDCTLGLGQDALVAARAVGPQGRVVGLEKCLPIWAVVASGLSEWPTHPGSCRIEAVHADSEVWLRLLPDEAFDVVVFDPMFGRPTRAQPGFELMRRFAALDGVSESMLREARRVARRSVVIKAARYSKDLRKLGLEAMPARRQSAVVWAQVAAAGRPNAASHP
ncbi:MAG: class I SAM-dependent methyltransferase [Myxococcaceae bacterium]